MSFKNYIKKYVDGKLILLLAGFYTVFYVIYIFKTAYLRAYGFEPGKYSLMWIILHVFVIDWIIVIFYMSLIAISTKRLIKRKFSWTSIFLIHLSLSLFIGIIIRFLSVLYDLARGNIGIADLDLRQNITSSVMVMDLNFLIYFAMVLIIYVYYYVHQIKEAEEKRVQLETQLVNTRMEMLSAQLQPHFLFNTLNSISSLIEFDAKAAQNTLADLSGFLREILYNSEARFIPLGKELEVLEYYLNILKIRFSDHLIIEKNIDNSLCNSKVPAMILQPVVENSIKHGYSYNHTNLKITISAERDLDMLILKIANNGEQLSVEEEGLIFKKGVGLSNLKERLENIYGKEQVLSIKNKPQAAGVETILKLSLKN